MLKNKRTEDNFCEILVKLFNSKMNTNISLTSFKIATSYQAMSEVV